MDCGTAWSMGAGSPARISSASRSSTAPGTASPAGGVGGGGERGRARGAGEKMWGVTRGACPRRDESLFVEDRLSHDFGGSKLELSAGVRHDRYDTFGSQTSPRVAAALVRGGAKWRAAYGEGFRAPAVGELYYPFSRHRDPKAGRH